MTNRRILGTEEARKQFPSLVARANQGKTTLITRHGKPYAALVPPPQARASRGESFVSLRGSGKGLYGKVARYIDALRREWD
ncbi:MAG: type II toxin-antitoxin system Phd/YefM family antitoxin [Betaproteobacteria bacterium]|nr:type II toxin-antitoxin system Phd/YefM family antitoxin [Betaproteobacteria bacterium]